MNLRISLTPRRRRALRMVLLAGAAVLLPLAGLSGASVFLQDKVDELSAAGWWTLPVLAVLAGLAIGLALIPSHLTSLLAGYLYGPVAGFATALAAVMVGVVVGFHLTGRVASDVLRDWIDRSRFGRLLVDRLIDAPLGRALLAIAFARLPPQVPFALGNILAASCRVRLAPLLMGTALGMAPRVGLVVWIGAELSVWEPGHPVPAALQWAMAATVIGFGGLAIWSALIIRRGGPGKAGSAGEAVTRGSLE